VMGLSKLRALGTCFRIMNECAIAAGEAGIEAEVDQECWMSVQVRAMCADARIVGVRFGRYQGQHVPELPHTGRIATPRQWEGKGESSAGGMARRTRSAAERTEHARDVLAVGGEQLVETPLGSLYISLRLGGHLHVATYNDDVRLARSVGDLLQNTREVIATAATAVDMSGSGKGGQQRRNEGREQATRQKRNCIMLMECLVR